MPAYFRVNVDGSLSLGAEKWSTSWAISDPIGSIQPPADTMSTTAEAIRALFAPTTGWPSTMKGGLSAAGTIDRVRLYWYEDLGQPAAVAGVSVGAPIPGEGTATMPPQNSMVLSLRSGRPGRSQRGRIYWPHCGGTVSTSQRSNYVTQTVANAAVSMLGAVETLPLFADGVTSIASAKEGGLTTVSAVTVDNVIDTQRRRRDKLTGTAYFAPFAH